jgi:hypothetical protein
MVVVELVHSGVIFKVTAQRLVTHCSLFSSDPSLTLAPYAVRSSVSLPLFRDFVAALEDGPLTIGNENVRGLSLLCAEFGFLSLAAKVSESRSSPLAVRLKRVSSARLRSRPPGLSAVSGGWKRKCQGRALLCFGPSALKAAQTAIATPASVAAVWNAVGEMRRQFAATEAKRMLRSSACGTEFPGLFLSFVSRSSRVSGRTRPICGFSVARSR